MGGVELLQARFGGRGFAPHRHDTYGVAVTDFRFHNPTAVTAEPKNTPVNTLGIRRIMFAVEDIEDVLARLRAHGAELVGELDQYENTYRLCYARGPEGIIVALAEQLS